jgi:hypothetical protein
MERNVRKWLIAGIAVVVVVGLGIAKIATDGGGSSNKPLLITATAVPRDLKDKVTVSGTLARAEKLTVNSPVAGQVTHVDKDAGANLGPNESILSLNGRDSVTEVGTAPFFRKLDVGAEGTDVLQLEEILRDSGFSPGTVDETYTQQTQFALAQWQAAHQYPGAAPQVQQAVNVSLMQSTGYVLGAQSSAGLTIGPPATVHPTALRSPGGRHASDGAAAVQTVAVRNGSSRAAAAGGFSAQALPNLTIASTGTVQKGAPATFIVSASQTSTSAIDFTVSLSGTAGANDVIAPAGPFTLPANASSVAIQIVTRQNTTVEPNKTLIVTLDTDAAYNVGSPGSATTTIISNDVPQLTLSGSTTVARGQSATITVTADQAPVRDTQVVLNAGGTAQPGTDYVSPPPTVTLAAGQTTASVTVTTKTSSIVSADKQIVVSLGQSSAYRVGPIAIATITIAGTSGSGAIPVITIRPNNLRVTEGTPAQFVVSIDRQLSTTLDVSLNFGGNATAGSNYSPPGGLLEIPAGQTSLQVVVPTLDDSIVSTDKLLYASMASSADYTIGNPGLAGIVIVNQDLPKIHITGGPATISQGGGAVFTITADQAPVKDTSIQYQTAGTAQPGVDLQPNTGTVLLRAGQTSVTVTILTLNTNVFFLPTDMIAGTWPTRLGEVLVKNGDLVQAGAPLFSLTETALTVTLSASASDRTKLKVGQAATVQLSGGDGTTAAAVITELDATPTTDPTTKKQSYEGKVQVKGTLGAADGAPVTIDVVLQERHNALTVPIAAVKQNGDGADVVRVIDLAHGGKVREVIVKTGLSEGSYIEIRSGLNAQQIVVVEIDQTSAK